MKRIDIADLKKSVEILDVIGRRVSLRKKGSEHVGICPFHNDTKASLQVNTNKQVFACFACGKSGDAIDFLVDMGATFQEAVAELSGEGLNHHEPEKRKIERKAKPLAWTQVVPAPKPGQITHYRHGAPSHSWEYHAPDGSLMGLICRFDTPEGKEVLPYTYCTDGTRSEWRWQGFNKPRPLYGLDKLAERPTATVLLVEGEKTADAAAKLLPHIVVATWQGGAKAIQNADWTPLNGRSVVLWPDNDAPGTSAMLEISALLQDKTARQMWVPCPADAPPKWDVADADWTPEQALAYVRANMTDVPTAAPEPEPEPEQEPPYEDQEFEYTPPPPDFGAGNTAQQHSLDDAPFDVLGFTKEAEQMYYVFFTRGNYQVQAFKATNLSGNTLLSLAPLSWWQMAYPKKGGKFDQDAAVDDIIRRGDSKGMFNPRAIRGRGAWMDGGRVVIHAGDKLVVDGRSLVLSNLQTKYIYELAGPLSFPTENPMSVTAANRLMDVVSLCNWERPINAHLLAGWCVIAPVCGALRWRPHVWITGSAGTGKSWVFKNIVRKLLGANSLSVQSETSEAGIRQALKSDAMPIVFDEAEGEDKRARERMDAVLSLMRASSAEDGGVMLKGSASGKVQMYSVRSCFAFASIGVQITQQSDRGRVTILGLNKPVDRVRNDRWDRLKKIYLEVITPDFVSGLQARTVSMLPVILDNAETFAQAASLELGEQRAGDQLGALLAGAYSLYSNNRITLEAAIQWVKDKDWDEERSLDLTRDEHALMARLMDYIIRVDGPNVERSVGEMLMIASHVTFDENVSAKMAADRLLRYGFKVDGDHFLISQSNTHIAKMVADTAWAKSIGRTLTRVEGAQAITSARFGPGQISRAVKIPLAWLTN